jgi:hypothetical protein
MTTKNFLDDCICHTVREEECLVVARVVDDALVVD